jgi:peroxin-4
MLKFITKIFHPNVKFSTGEICLDILKAQKWSPAWSLQSTSRAIVALLSDPAADRYFEDDVILN